MKKKIVIFLTTAICLISLALGLSACGGGTNQSQIKKTAGSEGLMYSLTSDGDSYICSGIGTCTETEIEIASWYNEKWVTAIGSSAFRGCAGLTSIKIPDSVTSIYNQAFQGCAGLTSIKIPDSVTSIYNQAFQDCTSLTSVTIPDSVTSISDAAFFGCTGLTSITIGNSVTSIGEDAFAYCMGLTSVTIPDSVTSIGNYAFIGCTSLISIQVSSGNTVYHSSNNCLIKTESKTLILGCKNSIIPTDGTVTSIGDYAFAYCTGLTSVTIGNGVMSIGNEAFRNCTGLTSVTIGNGVTSIGGSAFV